MPVQDIFTKYIAAQQAFDAAIAEEISIDGEIKAAIEKRKKIGKTKEEAINRLNAAKAELIATL